MDRNTNENAPPMTNPDEPGVEVLIGRLVDSEASDWDRSRFEELASTDPTLWRLLAMRHQDHASLTARFEHDTRDVDHTELPAQEWHGRVRSSWLIAGMGWAAVLVLGTFWTFQVMNDRRHHDDLPGSTPVSHVLSPDEHLRMYLDAPFVNTEYPPTLLNAEPLPDGRTMIRILRRIEEIAYLEPSQEIPVDANRNLTKSPLELRGAEVPGSGSGMNSVPPSPPQN